MNCDTIPHPTGKCGTLKSTSDVQQSVCFQQLHYIDNTSIQWHNQAWALITQVKLMVWHGKMAVIFVCCSRLHDLVDDFIMPATSILVRETGSDCIQYQVWQQVSLIQVRAV